MSQKRIVTIQDISCFGKCSLTVALPIISACSIECDILPTALLSTHTAFNDFTFLSLDDELKSIYHHWQKLNLHFDGIYTGYLGSGEQIDLILDFISKFKTEENFLFVDPAMADNGKLYSGFDLAFVDKMRKLFCAADIADPNLSEACFLADVPYKEIFSEDELIQLCKKLSDLGPSKIILTGVKKENQIGAVWYDKKTQEFNSYFHDLLAYSSHGTGDVFSSVLSAMLTLRKDLKTAIQNACDFTFQCMKVTEPDRKWHHYGVQFEKCIPALIEMIADTEK